MSRVIYGVIGIFVIAVIVLTGLVGYLYGQEPQTVTVTIPTTTTVTTTQPTQATTKTITVTTTTQTQTVTTTTTYTSSQTQPNQYGIEVTTETQDPIYGGSVIIHIKVSGPARDITLIISDSNMKTVSIIPISKEALLDGSEIVQTSFLPTLQLFKEGIWTFILASDPDGNELYRTDIEIPGAFSRFEKLEITSAYATDSTHVTLNVKNTGSTDTSITDLFVNGKLLSVFDPGATGFTPGTLASGQSASFTLTFTSGKLFSGVTYDFKIHTASGTDYPKAVIIP